MVNAIWYVLMYYSDQIKLENVPLFIRKNIDYSYRLTHLSTLLLWVILLLVKFEKHGLVDAFLLYFA